MAFDQNKSAQTVWAILLTAMGILLCLKTPYALRRVPDSGFLNFARYFIGILLVLGGVKKFYGLYVAKRKTSPPKD